MGTRSSSTLLGLSLLIATAALAAPLHAQAGPASSSEWVTPRTANGHPDLQGNWTNMTLTPFSRPRGQERVLTAEQVRAIEEGQAAEDGEAQPGEEALPVALLDGGQRRDHRHRAHDEQERHAGRQADPEAGICLLYTSPSPRDS